MGEKSKIELIEGAALVRILQQTGVTIYPIVAPEKAGSDYVVYRRTSLEGYDIKGRITPIQQAYYILNVVSDEYAKGVKLTQSILDALGNYSDANIMDITIDDLSEEYSEGFFIQTIKIKIITN